MTDLVLARKYRPRSFDQMVGQAHVVQALGNALASGRLHHAYLFTGTRGIGKTTVSRILAKSLNCTGLDGLGGVTRNPCGQCQACTEIDADRFIDYIELDAASNRSIDEVRDLIERAAYKPSVGRYKVFMIDEAHQLTKDAFNALLKTLEEPPEYLKFVLATTDPEKMLPTVLSRCLQFNLRPMAPDTVREHLAQVLAAEGVAHDEGALRVLGRAARGSMRDALSLTDQALAYGNGALSEAGVRAMLGVVDGGHAAALVAALAARDGAALLAGVQALREAGASAAGTLEAVATLLQQMAVEQAVPGALDASDPDTAPARTLAPQLAADETQLYYSLALQGRGELHLMADEYGALSMVLLRCLAFAPGAPGASPAQAAVPRPAAPLKASAPPRLQVPVAKPAVSLPQPSAAPAPTPPAAMAKSLKAAEPELPPWLSDGPPPEDDNVAASAAPAPADNAPPALPVAARALLQPTALGERWAALVQPLLAAAKLSALVRELALQAEWVSEQGQAWQLRVERESLRTPALRDKLAAVLAEAGHAVTLELLPGVAQDSPALREAAARAQRQQAAEATVQADPRVQALLQQFRGARIVPGSIQAITSTTSRSDTP